MTFDGEALSLSILGDVPLGESFSIFGRAGIAVHRYKVSLEASLLGLPVGVVGGPGDQSVGAAVLGAGIEWMIHSDWALRLQGQRHFVIGDDAINLIERGDVTSMTVGVSFKF
jgi:opacity protein-like surface antigen